MAIKTHYFFKLTLPDTTEIDILAVYASSDDTPKFWEEAHTILNTGKAKLRLMLGDYNCTLDHNRDDTRYKTDPHSKSRKILNAMLDNEELIDSYRHFHPDSCSYTYRNKKNNLRGRLDYGLISPSLIPSTKKVNHIAHNYLLSDHANFSITH